jgi:predicted permease
MGSFACLFRNLRYAVRSWRNSSELAAAAIITLALGIGANTAIFNVLEGVVLDPLPYPQPDRLVVVTLYNRTLGSPTYLSYPDFIDWQRSFRSFDQLAAIASESFDLTSPGAPEHVDGKEVSADFFTTLGVTLAAGRGFTADEDKIGGVPAVVISNRLWQQRFGGSPAALGRTLTLNGVDHSVVGVLPPRFRFGNQPADVYTPIASRYPLYINDRTVHDVLCVGRLRPGVGIGQALAEMNTVQEHIDELYPNTERGQQAYVIPLKQSVVGDIGGTLLLLLGAVGLVLLIACTNVANLLLARSTARKREFALRMALGATRVQIVRQLLAETLLLSVSGGLFGLAIAKWGVTAVLAAAPGTVPRVENIGVNAPVMLFALGVSIAVGIVFGLLPGLRSSRTDLQTALKEGSRNVAGGHRRMQNLLVVLQVALALVLLTGAGLLLRTVRNLWAVNPGFDSQHVLTLQVGLSRAIVNTSPKVRTAYRELTESIRRIPGVEAADITALVPLSRGANEGPFWVGRRQPAAMPEIPRAIYYPTGPDYVRTMGIPLVSGRLLRPSDNLDSPVVVLVDSLLARRFFGGQDPVGQTITIPHWGAVYNLPARIVGVVGHVEHSGLDGSMGEKPQLYYSIYQLPDEALPVFRNQITVAVRTGRDADGLLPALRDAVRQAGSDQPVYNIRTMQELVSGSMGRQRFPMLLLVAFALLALVLAIVGIYGVISYSTIRRVNEIGIRMALGATKRDVLRMIVGQGIRLAVAGVSIGSVAALAVTRLLSSFSHLLYGVGANDPAILVAVAVVLVAAAALACYIPARRAASLEATAALRQE